ncbi:MAG: ADP-ribosylglycohydrolase family protein [Firmicutes bacterium]|nr:ADP-ribosylglycohydrolase family protein [Bacillota bacterium]
MAKAWEIELEERRSAKPRIVAEHEENWEGLRSLQCSQDNTLKMLWHSEVPGSGASECLMRGAVQAAENRGLDVSAAEPWLAAGNEAFRRGDMGVLQVATARLLHELDRAPKKAKSPYWSFHQIQTWEEHAAAARFPAPVPVALDEDFARRVYGGWLAQICGGALGTALEGYTTENIAAVFGEVRGYVRKPDTYNDDITFELAFLEAFKERGYSLASADVADRWVGLIPFGWSAELIALQNLKLGVYPPESGVRSNPFCEWIGAQMRGAVCGLVAPGDAREAARLAWIDAVISHAGNGALGETFNAILTALAFVRRDVRALLEEVAALMPEGTQYRWVIEESLKACRETASAGADAASEAGRAGPASDPARTAWDRLERRLEHYNWVHAYPNAAAEVVALWFGGGDFDATMRCIAMAGQDVDCNAAQIATVLGVMNGPESIAANWTGPIGDTLDTYVRGLERLSIKGLAEDTAAAVRRHQQ